MDLTLTPEERAFQEEVRAFLHERLPDDVREGTRIGARMDKERHVRWQKILYEQGWMAPNWPVEHGGTGWTPLQRYLFEEEMEAAWAPPPIPFGVHMVGPVIIAFGTGAQKRRFLPRILASEDWWCQGYSEPGAGSDLAALKTRAVRDGDHYVVNGQKTWTSLAQHADWIFCLVRTSQEGKRQEGISFLLIDMHSPGVTVRPIRTMDGSEEINDTFFEEVRVPVENLVGEEGKGWTYAKYLLGHERTGIAGVARSKAQLRRIREIAANEMSGGCPLAEDRRFRERLAEIEVDLMALEHTILRIVSAMNAGATPRPGGVDPQDQGHRDPAGADRGADADRRLLRPPRVSAGRAGRERGADRPRVRPRSRGPLLQLAQGVDLRGQQRDPAQHRGQDGARAVGGGWYPGR